MNTLEQAIVIIRNLLREDSEGQDWKDAQRFVDQYEKCGDMATRTLRDASLMLKHRAKPELVKAKIDGTLKELK